MRPVYFEYMSNHSYIPKTGDSLDRSETPAASRSQVRPGSAATAQLPQICDVSGIHCVNVERVKRVLSTLADETTVEHLSEVFRTLGDPTRVKIVSALLESELCVLDIAAVAGVSQSAVSHQLRVLRQQRLVKHRREGQLVYYSLDDEHIERLLSDALDHIGEEPADTQSPGTIDSGTPTDKADDPRVIGP